MFHSIFIINIGVNCKLHPQSLGVIRFYPVKFQNLDFTPYILGVFGFYSLEFEGVWILNPKISKFGGVKSQHPQTLWDKIQILKCQDVKSKLSKLKRVKAKF